MATVQSAGVRAWEKVAALPFRRGILLGVALLLAAATVLSLLRLATGRGPADEEHWDSLTVAVPMQLPSALLFLALEADGFRAHHLLVRPLPAVSGARALTELLQGRVDVTTVGDVPLALAAFERDDLRVLATISTGETDSVLAARTDRGLAGPANLVGRRIGTQRNSALHFFLHLFLVKHGIPQEEVEVVFLRAEELVPALLRGDVDACSLREPFISQARQAGGAQVQFWPEPDMQLRTELLVTLERVTREKPHALSRLLAGLVDAQHLARERPDQLVRAAARLTETPPDQTRELLAGLDLRVQLDQTLIVTLEDEARWTAGAAPARPLPNYARLICPEPLRSVAPDAVQVLPVGVPPAP